MSTPSIALERRPAEERKGSAPVSRIFLYVLMALVSIFFLVPVYVAIVIALMTTQELATSGIWAPSGTSSLTNFTRAFDVLVKGLGNSLILSIPAVDISALL